jgi:hypothetical protein
MNRIKNLSLATLAGAALLAGSPAAAQERDQDRDDRGRYSVADNDDNYREREVRNRADIPSGTAIAVTLDEEVPVNKDNIGETYDAHVDRNVEVEGDVVIREGAPARVKLVESSEKSDAATLRLTQVEVNGEMRDVAVSDAKADEGSEQGGLEGLSTGEKTAAGAAAGAVIGAVTGAGVLEGAVLGAGGGLAWGLLSGRAQEIDDGTTLKFELEEELNTR